MATQAFNFEISLAQWSLHKSFFEKKIKVLDFANIAREDYEIGAVEYVNQFFLDKAKDQAFLRQLKQNAMDSGVKNLLIMIDKEGELAASVGSERLAAVEKHKKWIEAAAFLDCDAVRVNLHGSDDQVEWMQGSCESLALLAEFAQSHQLKVLVENHGGLSAKINLLMDVIHRLQLQNLGTMPDFGNFCIRRQVPGDLWLSPCVEQYDPYQGVAEMLPYAGAISAKTFHFDEAGNERDIDFHRMLKLIKAANYQDGQGYIGIEYEGESLTEDEGIRRTKALLERLRKQLVGTE